MGILKTAVPIGIASLLSIGSASAASLTIIGGTSGFLNHYFDPNTPGATGASGGGLNLPDGIGPNTAITIFNSANTSGVNAGNVGLAGTPVGPNVTLTFTYMGYEAGYTNDAFDQFNYSGTPIFENHEVSTPGSSSVTLAYNLTSPGLIPFTFNSKAYTAPGGQATNGGPVSSNVEIAFAILNSTTAYAFFEDIAGAGTDQDFDDMVVKIQINDATLGGGGSTVPLPGALPLFAAGLGLMGFVAKRRKRKGAAAIAA